MSTNTYLRNVLSSQTFGSGSSELNALREKRDEVEKLLKEEFSGVTIRYAGSYAKKTMIRESYDLDVTCYFSRDATDAGTTLEEIFGSVQSVLADHYGVQPKTSTIRLSEREPDKQYTHIDVVPGRFIEGNKGDVFLYQSGAEKHRLKTNLGIHIETIRDSGLTDAIRLLKYWRERSGVRVKTFVLELLAVQVLKPHKAKELERQLTIFWEKLRDDIDRITVQDPANPEGNDLTPIVNEARVGLHHAAEATLATIGMAGWEPVFGNPDDELSEAEKAEAITTFSQTKTGRAKPWAS
jgi:hypothetical protein